MKLRYISLFMDYDSGYPESLSNAFNLHSRFISNFLSVQIRKQKIDTDGTFKMISVTPSLNIKHVCRIVGENALQARLPFDEVAYKQMVEIQKYEYYLQLLEEGYEIYATTKEFPKEQLLRLHHDFRNSEYKNEWLHKKKRFNDIGIEVVLSCSFTSIDFQLKMTVNDIESKQQLVSGTVIRTLPDEVCFANLFKDILVEDERLVITERFDRPKFAFKLNDLLNGKLVGKELLKEEVYYDPLIINDNRSL